MAESIKDLLNDFFKQKASQEHTHTIIEQAIRRVLGPNAVRVVDIRLDAHTLTLYTSDSAAHFEIHQYTAQLLQEIRIHINEVAHIKIRIKV